MKRKIKFNCLCGHEEKTHNFDPDSIMFGCLYSIITVKYNLDGDIGQKRDNCYCREFRPDNLRYLEERSER